MLTVTIHVMTTYACLNVYVNRSFRIELAVTEHQIGLEEELHFIWFLLCVPTNICS